MAQYWDPEETRVALKVDDRTEDFTIAPTTRVLEPGGVVRWASEDGPFVIHFNHRTPVGRVVIHSRLEGTVHEAHARIEEDTRPGVYEYAIAISKGDQVFIHVSGEVRIERPRGG